MKVYTSELAFLFHLGSYEVNELVFDLTGCFIFNSFE